MNPDVVQFCATLESRAREHGYDIVARPRQAEYPRYEWKLACGHSLVLGIPTLERYPRGRVWCPQCNDLSAGLRCVEVKSGL